jgi:hypothetical protein
MRQLNSASAVSRRADVISDGINWHVQRTQNGHATERERAGQITLDAMKGAEPWSNYGQSLTVQVTSSWKQFTGCFRAIRSSETSDTATGPFS